MNGGPDRHVVKPGQLLGRHPIPRGNPVDTLTVLYCHVALPLVVAGHGATTLTTLAALNATATT